MVDTGDLVRAIFGHRARTIMEAEVRTNVIDEFKPEPPKLFLDLLTNEGENLNLEVDTSKSFYSIFGLVDYEFSKSHKNHTISKGKGRTPRVFVTLPKPGKIKALPEYTEWRQATSEWYAARDQKIKEAIETRFRQELSGVMPEYEEVLALTAETAPAYFEAKGWDIPADIDWTGFCASGWIMTERPDGFGHTCGAFVNMDWEAKRAYISGFSSDD